MHIINDDFVFTVPSENETDNPWLKGPFRPQRREHSISSDEMKILGKIPVDLDGVYIRNTHNQTQTPLGVYHPFDGEGMLHAIRFEEGKCEYRNRFVRTTSFYAEQAAGTGLWPGLLNPELAQRRGWGAMGTQKDNAGVDVAAHAGRIIPSMAKGSEPWRLSPYTLETMGVSDWNSDVPDGICSHYKVDIDTGDMIFFNFPQDKAPYFNYGVVSREDRLVHYTPIDFGAPFWVHDIGMTKNYSVLNHMPYGFNPKALEQGVRKLEFRDDVPTRLGVIPRFGAGDDIRWFEFEPSFFLHVANCYEDGDWVIHDGPKWDSVSTMPVGDPTDTYAKIAANLDRVATNPHMYRWAMNLRTGETKEGALDDRAIEFPMVANDWIGKKYRYSYNLFFERYEPLASGMTRYDLLTQSTDTFEFGESRYGSEVGVAPKLGSSDEDDVYIITFVTDMKRDRSECLIFEGKDIKAGPICTIVLPERIAVGSHACWVEGDRMDGEKRGSGEPKMYPLGAI